MRNMLQRGRIVLSWLLMGAMAHAFLTDPNQAKVVRIKNTLKLEDIECSLSCLEDIKNDPDMTVTSEPFTWKFNEEDNLW